MPPSREHAAGALQGRWRCLPRKMPALDDAEFIRCAALAGTACRDAEERRHYLARLHRGLVKQLTVAGVELMRAVHRADVVVDKVRAEIIDKADSD